MRSCPNRDLVGRIAAAALDWLGPFRSFLLQRSLELDRGALNERWIAAPYGAGQQFAGAAPVGRVPSFFRQFLVDQRQRLSERLHSASPQGSTDLSRQIE